MTNPVGPARRVRATTPPRAPGGSSGRVRTYRTQPPRLGIRQVKGRRWIWVHKPTDSSGRDPPQDGDRASERAGCCRGS
jgi:hypothetical protein